jgi:hypothetical protein
MPLQITKVALMLALLTGFSWSQSDSAKPSTYKLEPAKLSPLHLEKENTSFAPLDAPLFGLFPPVDYLSGGDAAWAVAVADLNGDGKPDLVFTNADSGSVGILLGNGDGTFQPATTLATLGAVGLVVADVNGDGRPDIIVATGGGEANGDGAAAILLGNGDGTFQPPVYCDAGADYAYDIAVGDFNGDGKPDLVLTDCSPITGSDCGLFSILLGNGDGTFKPAVTYNSGGVGAWSVAVGDLNGDGKADLVIGNLCANASCPKNAGVVAVLLGTGDGTFQPPVPYSSGGGTLFVAVADVNLDGKPDIVVTNSNGEAAVGVLLGNGDGTFQPVTTYGVKDEFVSGLAVADVNGDGKPDVVFADCLHGRYVCGDNSSVSVLLGNGNGTFQPALTFSSGGWNSSGVAVADLNGDGRADVLVANFCPLGGCPDGPGLGVVGVLLNHTKYPTTTTLLSNLNPSIYGQTITFTASVTGRVPSTGLVVFSWSGNTIGTASLSSNGFATLEKSKLNANLLPLTAVYKGDTNNLGSTSAGLNEVVEQTTSSATLTSSPNPSNLGQSVTFTAKILSPTVQAKGPVTFTAGKTVLGTAQLIGGKARLTISSLAVGSTKVTVTYYGDSNIKGSSASVTQVVK